VIWLQLQQYLGRWKNHFSQLFSVNGFSDVRQTEIHKAEPLVPKPSGCEVEMTLEKLKSQKSPGIDQIPEELIKAQGRTNFFEIHRFRRNCLRSGRSQSLYLFIRRAIKHIVEIIVAYHFCQVHTTLYPMS